MLPARFFPTTLARHSIRGLSSFQSVGRRRVGQLPRLSSPHVLRRSPAESGGLSSPGRIDSGFKRQIFVSRSSSRAFSSSSSTTTTTTAATAKSETDGGNTVPRARLSETKSSAESSLSEREKEAFQILMGVPAPGDPEQRDIVFAGSVLSVREEEGKVSVVLRLDQHYRELKKAVQEALTTRLPWATKVEVSMESKKGSTGKHRAGKSTTTREKSATGRSSPGLKGVKRIIAVSSCKGGVGKSTVAVNLAFALSRHGNQKVGIFDADIYGPSLPTMVNEGVRPPDLEQSLDDGLVNLPEYEGVKTMSYGYLKNASPAIARGPIVSNVVMQLLNQSRWGDLDYLIIDMPPGTGDIQLTMTQQLEIDGAVIVTTPQMLSFVDVVKGIQMFDMVKVPILSVVENMAYFDCGNCDTRHELFGPGYIGRLRSEYGIETSYQVPLLSAIATGSDTGRPVVLSSDPSTEPLRDVYQAIADGTHTEMDRVLSGGVKRPEVTFDEASRTILVKDHASGKTYRVDPAGLRRRCQCAACVDEFTGAQRLHPETVPESVEPTLIEAKGNYAVAMVWSDGHASSIYPVTSIIRYAETLPENQESIQ